MPKMISEKLRTTALPKFLLGAVTSSGLFALTVKPASGEFWPVVWEFLGSFHPLVLHLPIGLWFGSLCLLALTLASSSQDLRRILYFMAVLTVASGLLAFGLGIFLYAGGSYSFDLIAGHLLSSLAFLLGVTGFLWLLQKKASPLAIWLVALLSSAFLGIAGHDGGVMTHGEPMKKAPWVVLAERKGSPPRQSLRSNAGEETVFHDLVMPIIEEKCLACHRSERAKGKLRMDSYAALIKGGSKGTSIVPGSPAESLMLSRIHLPLSHKEHMPPASKEQLTSQELALLEWWVIRGAAPAQRVADAEVPEQLAPVVESFLGESPEAIQRRLAQEERARLLAHYRAVQADYPGVLVQAVEGEAVFELSSASIYGLAEAPLIAKILPVASALRRIDWTNQALTEEWLAVFLDSERLEVLNLANSQFTSQQMSALLTTHPKLTKLNLTNTPLGDANLPQLLPMVASGTLSDLIVSDTALSPEARKALQEAIPKSQVVF